MTFTWVVYYNTWIGKEASSLFLAHHPYDILKSKQVNILVTYWMKRLFQHWICSRTHRHSLQIFQQFLHNNLVDNLQVTRKFYSKRNNPFSSRNSVFLFKRPMQKKNKKKNIWLQIGKSGYIRCFQYQNVQFSTVFPAKIGLCLLLIIPYIYIHDKGPSWTVSLTG